MSKTDFCFYWRCQIIFFLIKKNAKAYTFVKSDAYRNFYLKAFTARAYTEYLNLMGISAKMRGIIVNLNAL